jgi:hypothetical protein
MNQSEDDPILKFIENWYSTNVHNGLLQIRSGLKFLQDELADAAQECSYYVYKRHVGGATVESQEDFDRLMSWCIDLRSINKSKTQWWRFKNLEVANEHGTNQIKPGESAHLNELKTDLLECIEKLQGLVRDIFISFLKGIPYKQIAKQNDVKYNVATSLVSRGRSRTIWCMTKEKGHDFSDLGY